MAGVSKFLQRLFNYRKPAAAQSIGPGFLRFAGKLSIAEPLPTHGITETIEGDRVLVDGKKLSGPLHKNHRLELPRGYIAHNDIIGKTARTFVATNVGQKYQITYPTLDQYIALTPRKVTPVYASYASLIVSLLDIHVAVPTTLNEKDQPLEILEAGTGHGALTLHLARAVHAANPLPPSLPPPQPDQAPSTTAITKDVVPKETDTEKVTRSAWEAYRASRLAIVHSIEISPTYSAHAQKLVHQFRRGMYAPHVDFHVANISDWIPSQLNIRHRNASLFRARDDALPFLSYVILDMPGSHLQIETVAPAMKDGALLVVFVPSVTQIGDCVRIIQDKGMKLQMEMVLELGEGISNGRVWDVRLARKRARSNGASSMYADNQARDEMSVGKGRDASAKDASAGEGECLPKAEVEPSHDDDPVMVCRPKVGKMTIGGGFIGLWRKMDSST